MIAGANWSPPTGSVSATKGVTSGTAEAGIQIRQTGFGGPLGLVEGFATGGGGVVSGAQRWVTSAGDSGWQVYCDTASVVISGSPVNTWISCDATQSWVVRRTVPSFGTNDATGNLRFRRGGIEYGSIAFSISATATLP